MCFLVAQSYPTLCDPARLLCPWNSPGKNTKSGMPFPSPEDLPNPDIKPRSPALQADFLPSEPPGNRKSVQIMADIITRHYKSDFKSNIVYLVRGVYMLSHV